MVMKVYESIANVSKELSIHGIGKSRKNQQQGYSFRGIDDVMNELSPLLAKNHLLILPRMMTRETTERSTKSGGSLFYTIVKAEFDFVCSEDGSKHTIITFGEAMDTVDKSTNKAMSAAYKYAAFQAFCIPVEGTPDSDNDTPPESTPKQSQPSTPPPASNQKAWGSTKPPANAGSAQVAERIKNINAWVMDILNCDTFQRTPETMALDTYKTQIDKGSVGLPADEVRKLKMLAFTQYLTCMITTAPAEELADKIWDDKIHNYNLPAADKTMLRECLRMNREAMAKAA